MKTPVLYQHSDNFVRVPVVDSAGNPIPASDFSDAEYLLVTPKGDIVVSRKLGDGIKVDKDEFVVHIDDAMLTSKHRGLMRHQLVVWNIVGDKLPPVFNGKVRILPVISNTV